MNFKEAAQSSPDWTAAGLLFTGFAAGIASLVWLFSFLNLEIDKRATVCPEGQGGITVETSP